MSYNYDEETKKGALIGIPIFLLVIMVIGWFVPFVMNSMKKTDGMEAFGVFSIILIAIFAFIMLAVLNEQVKAICNKKFEESKTEADIKKIALCLTLISSAVVFVLGYCIYDKDQDIVKTIILPFLGYLSTGWVMLILAVIFFVPLIIRGNFRALNDYRATSIIHTLIVVIGIIVTIPVYKANPGAPLPFFGSSQEQERVEDEYGNTESTAFVNAEYEVKKRLKSPSTAKFCKSYEAEIHKDEDNTWTVEGWVEAQNSFGATLKEEFVVRITFTGKNKYNIEYCVFR